MKNLVKGMAFTLLSSVAAFSYADTYVTNAAELKAAIENDEANGGEPSGGTIILAEGLYGTSITDRLGTITNKSLTLKPEVDPNDATKFAEVIVLGYIDIAGNEMVNKTVTYQNLVIRSGYAPLNSNPGLGRLNYIQNKMEFSGGSTLGGSSNDILELVVVGNEISINDNFYVSAEHSILFAGNTIEANVSNATRETRFDTDRSVGVVNIIGNTYTGGRPDNVTPSNDAALTINQGSKAFVYGNRVFARSLERVIFSKIDGNIEISNNLLVRSGDYSASNEFILLEPGNGALTHHVNNNVFALSSFNAGFDTIQAIDTTDTDDLIYFRNNLLIDLPENATTTRALSRLRFQNNTCVGASINEICQTENGIDANKNTHSSSSITFEDAALFKPSATEPLTANLGHPHPRFYDAINSSDLSELRNDIGIYGGPWSIEQFDIQMEANRTEPYVYPIFPDHGQKTQTGVKVKTLGVARQTP